MLMSAAPVFVGVPSLAVRTAMLMGLPFGASARVDMSEVERVGLGQIAHFELYQDPLRGLLEGGRAANARFALGVHLELHVSALVMSSVVLLLPTLALGTATAAPDHKEDGPQVPQRIGGAAPVSASRGGGYHRSRGNISSELRTEPIAVLLRE